MTARSMTLRSSRMFPGHVYRCSTRIASGDNALTALPLRSLNSRDERFDEKGDVLHAVAERGHGNADDVDAVVEIFPKFALLNRLRRVHVRGGHQADVNGLFFLAAEAAHGPLLQDAQQLCLDARRYLGDLVQKKRAGVSKLEAAWTPVHGAGKRAAFVTEDFVFQQRLGNGGAVDGDERLFGCAR